MKTDLRTIPGVGPNMEAHLLALGIRSLEDLKGKDPEELYLRDCARFPGETLDRCCLYVYRQAVAWAEGRAAPGSQWWDWKD